MVIFNTNQPLTVTDYALGQLTVKKITKLMGTEYLVDGVKFNVYEAVKDDNGYYIGENNTKYSKASNDPVASGNTENGIYTSVLLEPGVYIVEEDKESIENVGIVGWPKDETKTYHVITVAAGANKNDGSDHTFENPAAYGKFVLKKVDQDGKAIAGYV